MPSNDRLLTIGALCVATIALGTSVRATTTVTAAKAVTGSEGAFAYNNTSNTGAEIEGTVSPTGDTTVKLPFAMLGEYLAVNTQFGIGSGGVSTTGYGVGAEALGPNPALYAIGTGSGGGGQIVSQSKNADAGLDVESASVGLNVDAPNSDGIVAQGNPYAIYGFSQGGEGGYFTSNGGGTAMGGNADGSGLTAYGYDSGSGNKGGVATLGLPSGTGGQFTSESGGGEAQLGTSDGSGGIFNSTSGGGEAQLASSDGDGGDFSSSQGGIAQLGNPDGSGGTFENSNPNAAATAILATSKGFGAQITGGVGGVLNLYSNPKADGGDILQTFNSSGYQTLGLADSSQKEGANYSDMYLYGDLNVCNKSGCRNITASTDTADSTGRSAQTYVTHQSEPSVEDFGEGRIAGGAAYVRLDRGLSASISTAAPYLVFVTPNGDCRGLYVSNRTPAGFEVHELGGGRSTLAFSYRIVAKPLGTQATRFPAAIGRAMPRHMSRETEATTASKRWIPRSKASVVADLAHVARKQRVALSHKKRPNAPAIVVRHFLAARLMSPHL